jgi:hypothetical protein
MNLQKHIWEGWTVQSFIDELEWQVQSIMHGQSITIKFTSKEELKKWCMDNQPYYKKYIPEVVTYFADKYNLK